jgi:hypothetical protein
VSIKSRLRRLERARGGPCPECGDSPPRLELIVIWPTQEEERRIPEGEQFCPECGRQQWVVIRVVNDGTAEGEGCLLV